MISTICAIIHYRNKEHKMEYWALLYLHNWDADGKVYPQIHALYGTWQQAEAVRKAMENPGKYWVRAAKVVL